MSPLRSYVQHESAEAAGQPAEKRHREQVTAMMQHTRGCSAAANCGHNSDHFIASFFE